MEAAASNMIPEIAVMIGAFLDLPTIAHCTLVSKSWHAAFIPPLYRHVDYALDIDKHSTLNNVGSIHSNESRLNGFQRHGHHIRALTVSRQTGFPDPDIFGVDCRYLTELDLHLSSSPWTTNQTHDTYTYPDPAPRPTTLSKTHLVKLIDRNPNIQTLRIKGSQATKRYLLEAGLLRGLHLHALKTLDLNMGSQFSPELMREILDYGSGLEQLTCCKDDDLRSVIEQYRDTDTNNNNNNNNNIELATEYNGSHRTPWHRLRTLRLLQHLDLDGIDGEAEFNVLSEILKRFNRTEDIPDVYSAIGYRGIAM
ncbi:hypothetical protein BGX31_010128 [Mortierella sp. GBA43]|nr:hypothetical protein BGX31_010128 [Mortierella sp. GBA43]